MGRSVLLKRHQQIAVNQRDAPKDGRSVGFVLGIRTKVVITLVLLMLLSTAGGVGGYVLSTNATKNQLLDAALIGSGQRLIGALAVREAALSESAMLLAADTANSAALRVGPPDADALIDLDRRALRIRERFRLDQVLIRTANGQVRVNITGQSALSQVPRTEREHTPSQATLTQPQLIRSQQAWLLVAQQPIAIDGEPSASVLTVINVSEELSRLRRDLGLVEEIQLVGDGVFAATSPALAATPIDVTQTRFTFQGDTFHVVSVPFELSSQSLRFVLLRSEGAINTILNTGLHVMLLSGVATLALLLIGGLFLASNQIRPIRRLARVANAVAAGDLTQRANLRGSDEIGQLGHAFDQATAVQLHLLDTQARLTTELQAVLTGIADGVLAIDAARRITQINPAAAAMLGVDAHAATGYTLEELADRAEPAIAVGIARIAEQLEDELADTDPTVREERLSFGGRVLQLKSAPLPAVGGAVVLLQDVTSEVAADQAKSEFIAIASHELRTPLTSIVGYVDLLLMGGAEQLGPDKHVYAQTLRRQSTQLVSLVNDLLEMARIDQGRVVGQPHWTNMADTIDAALGVVHPTAAMRQIQLTTLLATDLPAVWIDPSHVRRIVINLVSNAIKYGYDGGTVTVCLARYQDEPLSGVVTHVWQHAQSDSVLITVTDNGVGIAAAAQPQIFERFFRADNPRAIEAGGTGLGLAITRALVELNGGQIGFFSVEGRGSTFWVRLPLRINQSIPMTVREAAS